jgi:hypothetical protein
MFYLTHFRSCVLEEYWVIKRLLIGLEHDYPRIPQV